MTSTTCSYEGCRDEMVVGYLYNGLEGAERTAFQQHLAGCLQCRREVEGLGSVRRSLGNWISPELGHRLGGVYVAGVPAGQQGIWRSLGSVPTWMRVAAAVLVIGLAAGAANLELRYDPDGVSLRTGWLAIPGATSELVEPMPTGTGLDAPWRPELAAFERRLRDELQPSAGSDTATVLPASRDETDEALLRQMRLLIEQSERRQQSELALRVAGAVQDVQSQRTADLRRIERALGVMESSNRALVIRQDQFFNDLAVRVSQGARP